MNRILLSLITTKKDITKIRRVKEKGEEKKEIYRQNNNLSPNLLGTILCKASLIEACPTNDEKREMLLCIGEKVKL